ncbi:MAG TPA: Gfo/Idh/MocA family oxidoreductase [Clostridia bacterium]|nr:Gfo/Idh/MocA family oxidoreductase [Clostridia bacterium]HRX42961.1 Gfo/Idh/MocA family oxidoreductase [Clostridia bacterium]
MTFRICHIGCGAMSVRGHGPALMKYAADYPDTEISACCDVDYTRAVAFCDEFGFKRAYSDWKKMLEDEKPDAVSLVVPVDLTSGMSVEILGLGFHLITEKPPGMTVEQCSAIVEASQRSDKNAGVMFNRRYMPLVKEMAEILKGREVEYLRYDFYRTGRKDADFSTTAIHGIDTAQMLAGGIYSEMSFTYQPLKTTPVGNILLSGITNKGTRVEMNFYPDSGMNAERSVIISEGSTFFLNIPIWDCPDYPGSIMEYRNGVLVREIHGRMTDMFISSGFYDEHRDFYESVRSGGPSPADMTQHMRAVELMEAIRYMKTEYRAKL